jgi:hypothetical protein
MTPMAYDPTYIAYGLAVIVLVLLAAVIRLSIRVGRLVSGKDGKSLEDGIAASRKSIEKLQAFEKEATDHFLNMEKRLSRSIQAVETVRFNPFPGNGEGGNQSFSTSFIAENGKGVVLSSLYSRDRVSMFSKPLDKFESAFELTEEEKQVVDTGKKSLQ